LEYRSRIHIEASPEKPSEIKFRDIFAPLTEPELSKAEENCRRYLEVAWHISAEQLSDSPQTDLDSPQILPTIEERSNSSLKN